MKLNKEIDLSLLNPGDSRHTFQRQNEKITPKQIHNFPGKRQENAKKSSGDPVKSSQRSYISGDFKSPVKPNLRINLRESKQ